MSSDSTLATATATRPSPPERGARRDDPRPARLVRLARQNAALAFGIALLSALLYAGLAWQQWHTLDVPSWDLGIFSELAKAYSTLSAPIVPIKGEGFNLLGDHFHPLLVLLGPVWAVWPSGLALLFLQAALFGAAAFPLTRLAADRFGTAFGAALGLAYALSWGLQSAVAAQFHEIAFAVPLLAFGLTAYLRGHLVSAALWIGMLVFVKEDLGVTVALFGLIVAVRPGGPLHPRRRAIGLALAVWGGVWLVLSTQVILPALNPQGQYDYTDRLGSPVDVFLPFTKWVTTAMLALTTGIVGLRSPLVLLMLPTLAWRFAGTVEHYWGWEWHYSAVLMPIAFGALLEAAPRDEVRRWWSVVVAAGVTLSLTTSLPLTHLLDSARWEPSPRLPAARAAVEAVRPGARIETDLTLMAPLVPVGEVYWMGLDNPVPDVVVLDLQSYVWRDDPPADAAAWAEREYPGESFILTFSEDDFQIAERVTP